MLYLSVFQEILPKTEQEKTKSCVVLKIPFLESQFIIDSRKFSETFTKFCNVPMSAAGRQTMLRNIPGGAAAKLSRFRTKCSNFSLGMTWYDEGEGK